MRRVREEYVAGNNQPGNNQPQQGNLVEKARVTALGVELCCGWWGKEDLGREKSVGGKEEERWREVWVQKWLDRCRS